MTRLLKVLVLVVAAGSWPVANVVAQNTAAYTILAKGGGGGHGGSHGSEHGGQDADRGGQGGRQGGDDQLEDNHLKRELLDDQVGHRERENEQRGREGELEIEDHGRHGAGEVEIEHPGGHR